MHANSFPRCPGVRPAGGTTTPLSLPMRRGLSRICFSISKEALPCRVALNAFYSYRDHSGGNYALQSATSFRYYQLDLGLTYRP